MDKLQELLQQNPQLLKQLQQPEPVKKEKKNKLAPGQTIELPVMEEPVPISMAQAKQLLKKQRKPRNLSEESKAKMLANLQKGREALKLKKTQMIQTTKKAVAEQVRPSTPVAKFLVKEPKPKKIRPVVVASDSDDDSVEAQIDHNAKLLKKIQQLQKSIPPPPTLQRQKRFSLFY
jgi:Ni,Fe-hydrogenase I large subunit